VAYNGSMIKYGKKIKQKARQLRKQKGFSYKEISDKLDIAKSTARLWCGDIILKPEHKKRLYTKQIEILSKGPNCSHERRKREISYIIQKGEKEIKLPLDKRARKLVGAALYWAEGAKTQHFAMTNSDPYLIKFFVCWLKDVANVEAKDLSAHLNIYPQQKDVLIKKFWSEITGIPLENFGKSFIKPKNKNYKRNTLYYGTIKIRVFKGTDLRHRVFGWVNAILEDVNAKQIEKIERRWSKLKTDYMRP